MGRSEDEEVTGRQQLLYYLNVIKSLPNTRFDAILWITKVQCEHSKKVPTFSVIFRPKKAK